MVEPELSLARACSVASGVEGEHELVGGLYVYSRMWWYLLHVHKTTVVAVLLVLLQQ